MTEEEKKETKEKKAKKKLTVQLLRETRKPPKENVERQKEQRKIIKAIKEALKSGPKTIPQIAEETGLKSDDVVWYLFSLRKYGEIQEVEEVDGYYTYKLVGEEKSGVETNEA